jgi:hypothetical protein
MRLGLGGARAMRLGLGGARAMRLGLGGVSEVPNWFTRVCLHTLCKCKCHDTCTLPN